MGRTIGQLANAAGVHVETVRYYQQLGLIPIPSRPARGVRDYPDEAVTRLAFIRRAQEVGFTLREISELLRLWQKPSCRDARSIAARKLGQVEAKMADLARVRSALQELVSRCDAQTDPVCPIVEAFAQASPRKGRPLVSR